MPVTIADPTPSWLRPENASVLDPWYVKALRTAGTLAGLADPASQAMGIAAPLEIPAGTLGGLKLFHGSPTKGLKTIQAAPVSRQFENATSQFGAFFTPSEAEAARYADIHRSGKPGTIYTADVQLTKPHEMTWNEFGKFQDITKDATGKSLDSSKWGNRQAELIEEAKKLRQELEAAGHDGIIVKNRSGAPIEVASFKDVAVK